MKIKKFIDTLQLEYVDEELVVAIKGWAVDLDSKKPIQLVVTKAGHDIKSQLTRLERLDVLKALKKQAIEDPMIGFELLVPFPGLRFDDLAIWAQEGSQRKLLMNVSKEELTKRYQKEAVVKLAIDKVYAYDSFYYINGWGGDNLYKDQVHVSLLQDNKVVPVKDYKTLVKKNETVSRKEDRGKIPYGFEILIAKDALDLDKPVIVLAQTDRQRKKIVQLDLKKKLEAKRRGIYLDNLHVIEDKESDDALLVLDGWAILNLQEDIMVSLLDENNRALEATVSVTVRPDLAKQDLITPYEMGIGFSLRADIKKKETYTLVVSNRISMQEKLLSPHFRANFGHRTPGQKIQAVARRLNKQNLQLALDYYKLYGAKLTWSKAKAALLHGTMRPDYNAWYKAQEPSQETLDLQRETQLAYSPKISVVVPTYKTPEGYLREMIESVQNQTYGNWELCIADGSQDGGEVAKILEEYAQKDSRIVYRVLEENLGIADNTNACLELATGDYIALFDHDDLLPPQSLFEIVKSLQEEHYDIVYTDEDKIDETSQIHSGPHFKPKFSWDLLRSLNYITHFFVVKKEIVDQVKGFNKAFDGAQDYDFILRCCEQTDKIHHIGQVLYHWRMHANSTAGNPESKRYAYEAGQRAIEAHLKRMGIAGHVDRLGFTGYQTSYEPVGNPLVSILIPSKDHSDVLDTCIQSILKKSIYTHFEIIIIENNSTSQKTFDYYEKIQAQDDRIKVVTWEGPFNYSAINNYGASFAKGKYLLLLNNDTELLTPTAIKDMLGVACQDGVGAVGAKLLFPDGTIQHAGVILGIDNVPTHILSGVPDEDKSYRHNSLCNYLAVTAACLMTPRQVFDQVGGLSEDFVVAFNDIDYCMKVYQAGYRIVNNGFAKWTHYESKSRGYENTPEKQKRFLNEKNRFKSKWDSFFPDGDPYYNHELPQ